MAEPLQHESFTKPVDESREAMEEKPIPRVILKRRRTHAHAGHPWIRSSAIGHMEGDAQDSDVVDVFTSRQEWLGRGILNTRSRISVRVYSWSPALPLDEEFFAERLSSAIRLRELLGTMSPTGATRLVNSEGDGLSGLIVDRYADRLVIHATSLAMAARKEMLVRQLTKIIRPAAILWRVDPRTAKLEGLEAEDESVLGEPLASPVFIEEHGIRYGVDIAHGQKTGFYLDQRENRAAAAKFLAGRRVLDAFSYTGAFSLCASRLGSAREVLALDTSRQMVETARANAALNELNNVRFEAENCFDALPALAARQEKFDAVILDPPKMASSAQQLESAWRAYFRLNESAVNVLRPDGILVTCSCTGRVHRDDFRGVLARVSQKTKRAIQIVEDRGAASDHPVLATVPEGDYLKCLICRVP